MRKTLMMVLAGGALLVGCASRHKAPAPQQAVRGERHSTTGIVRGFEDDGNVIIIAHDAFPGWMNPMTMPFPLADKQLASGLKVGDKVRFTVTEHGDALPITDIAKIQ